MKNWLVIDDFLLFSYFNGYLAVLKTNLQGPEKEYRMKKIFQIIFLRMNTKSVEQEIKSPVIYRRLADTPESVPGERTDLHKRQLTSAPVDFEVAPGRI